MGVVQLTTVTAINMMGSGIILLPATLAEIGTVSIFAWILASIGATILAYAFAKCGMYSKKVGGMGGYAEYRFGRLGNFLSNYTYAISLIIANVAIATGVVSYGSYVFGFDLSPMEVCLATISTLAIAASISLVGPKKFGKFTSLGMICILLPVIGLLLCGWYFFSPDIYVAAWNPHDMPFYLTMRDSIAVILWAFLGLETACANSDTVENPEKNVPVAVLAGTMIAGVCYMTSTAIIGGLVPHTELVSAGAPFGLAYAAMFGNTVGHMVSAMLVVSCFVSLTAWQFTISEVVREAATIGHFPSYLRKVNRFYAPYMAIGTLVCIQSLLTLSTISPSLLKQFNVLINLAVMVNLIPYLLAMAAVPDLQKAEGISAAKANLPNMAAIIGGVYSVYAVYGCGWDIILYGTLVTVFGIMIYMLKTARLSPAGFQTYPPKNNVSTSSLRKEVFLLRDTHDKTPLERGAFISYKPRFLFPYLHHMFLPILQEDCPIFPFPAFFPIIFQIEERGEINRFPDLQVSLFKNEAYCLCKIHAVFRFTTAGKRLLLIDDPHFFYFFLKGMIFLHHGRAARTDFFFFCFTENPFQNIRLFSAGRLVRYFLRHYIAFSAGINTDGQEIYRMENGRIASVLFKNLSCHPF